METTAQAGGLQTLIKEGLQLSESKERRYIVPMLCHPARIEDMPEDDRSVFLLIVDEQGREWTRGHWQADVGLWVLDESGGNPAGHVECWAEIITPERMLREDAVIEVRGQ